MRRIVFLSLLLTSLLLIAFLVASPFISRPLGPSLTEEIQKPAHVSMTISRPIHLAELITRPLG